MCVLLFGELKGIPGSVKRYPFARSQVKQLRRAVQKSQTVWKHEENAFKERCCASREPKRNEKAKNHSPLEALQMVSPLCPGDRVMKMDEKTAVYYANTHCGPAPPPYNSATSKTLRLLRQKIEDNRYVNVSDHFGVVYDTAMRITFSLDLPEGTFPFETLDE